VSIVSILQIVFISGIVLYAPSIALKAFLGMPVWQSILIIGLSGTFYTSIVSYSLSAGSKIHRVLCFYVRKTLYRAV